MAKPLFYRTYGQLAADIRTWSRILPEDIVAVAGISRSGMIVASMLMAERNIHVLSTDELAAGERPWEKEKRRGCPAKPCGGRILIIDDTVSSGEHMQRERDRFCEFVGTLNADHSLDCTWKLDYGAVYAMFNALDKIDHFLLNVGTVDHIFEWNWHHHWFLENCLLDMDGVLCEDWMHGTEEDHLAPAYLSHLENAKPLMKPSFEIGEIVTGRLEKYRPQTESWLAKNGIRYKKLTMTPFDTPAQRALNGGSAVRKSMIYQSNPDAIMFVESCPHQASVIAKSTGRPVLSYQEQRFFNGAM